VERIESLFPVLYVYRKERSETAGAGRWRGGVGIEYMIMPYGTDTAVDAVFFGSAAVHCETKGASGGFPGSVQRSLVLRNVDVFDQFGAGTMPLSMKETKAERIDLQQAKDATTITTRDAWVCFCDGGGGFGDPLERDPEHVKRDVGLGLCTTDEASRLYQVLFDGKSGVDGDRTAAARSDKRKWRHQIGRRLGADWKPGLKFEGPQRFRYGECLAVRDTTAGPAIGCIRCGHTLCDVGEDPRSRSLMVEEEMSALSPLNKYGREEDIVIREYCCPGCATVFSTDVQFRVDDPATPEMLLDPAQFEVSPAPNPALAG
jgi:N-methylhydantoinase B